VLVEAARIDAADGGQVARAQRGEPRAVLLADGVGQDAIVLA
jgi:hypothetical protein